MYHDDDIEDLTPYGYSQWKRKKNHYEASLWNHPDCRDPDHPGCEACMNEEDNLGEDE